MTRLLAALLLCCAACGGDKSPPPASEFDAARPKRVFDPPPGEVRPVPPFAIRADGIGPYLLGADRKEVLDIVPRGPRIELLTIVGVAEAGVVRSEKSALLIGSQDRRVTYVAVVEPEIAKTATGIGVGATVEELGEAFADAAPAPARRAADPRLREFSTLPGVRFIVDAGRVVTVLVGGRDEAVEPDPPGTVECRAGAAWAEAGAAIDETAKLDEKPDGVAFGCFTSGDSEAIVFGGDRFAIVGGAPDRPKRLAQQRVANLRYAAPIDVDGDGRDEVVAVSLERDKEVLSARVELLRWEAGKLESVRAQKVYEITDRSAALAGANLDAVDLLIEVSAAERDLNVGGVYLHRVRRRTREVAPLETVSMSLRKERPK